MRWKDDANPALTSTRHPSLPINPQFTFLPPQTPQQGGDDVHAGPLTWDEITHIWSHKQGLHLAFTGVTKAGERTKKTHLCLLYSLYPLRKPLHLVCYTGPLLIHCSVGEQSSGSVNKRQKGNIETDQNHRIAARL